MKNIFRGAKFGDKFKTRDGRCAILIVVYDTAFSNPANLWIEGEDDCREYKLDGTHPTDLQTGFCITEENGADIVARWSEHIDNKILNKIAHKCCRKIYKGLKDNKTEDYINILEIGFKAGYHTANDR